MTGIRIMELIISATEGKLPALVPVPVIEARSVTADLGGRQILHDLAFSVERGTWVGIVGPNGSGKTTLLRAIAGLLPYGGSLLLDGREVAEWSVRERARRLAFVRQTQPLAFDFSVMDFVLLGRAPHHGWLEPLSGMDRSLAMEALREMGLVGFEERSITAMSGGEQQRVRLAQALVQDAPVLLLDEPTAHLDVHHQLDLMGRIAALAAGGRTILSALHDLPLAARYVDRLLVLDAGHVAADGVPADVITSDLLRAVFRVEAKVLPGDPASVRFLAAV
jgi:iron complex transport system ATP-binding protein